MKTYIIKEVFGPTVQGEGSLAGTVTAFLRFAGCNMWDGRPETKAASACPYCDTDFRGGERMSAGEIGHALLAILPSGGWVTISGGEPLLQLDGELAAHLARLGFRLAIETNGTRVLPLAVAVHVSHVTMSPKLPPSETVLAACDDLKVLYPHPNPAITPAAFADFPARRRFIQPVNDERKVNDDALARALAECYALAQRGHEWSLSVQLHKLIGVQ